MNYELFPDIKEFHDTINRLAAESACREYFGINVRDPFPLDVSDEDKNNIVALMNDG